jgi:hypothetical protein
MRELIVAAMHVPLDYVSDTRDERLMRLLLDELREVDVLPLHLPMPRDDRLRTICEALVADSDEGGHLFQSDRGHHSNLMAASLVSSRGPVLVMSWHRSPGQVVASGLLHFRPRFLPNTADRQRSFHWRC